jgi:lipoprotein-releasing system permease protein
MLIKQKKLTAKPNFTTAGADYIGGFAGIGVIANLDDKTDEYDFTQAEKSIGQKVILTTGTVIESARPAGDSALPQFKRRTIRFTVTDVVFSGMYEIDKNFIYLPIETLSQKLYPEKPKVADTIHIKLTPGSDHQIALAVVEGIWQNFALKKFAWARSAKITTSIQMQAKLVTEYRKQMAMLMLVFGVISGGVILLIFCIFYLIVMTKQKDIAVVKSCGLGSTTVAMIFITFGLLIGLLGSALGVALGFFFTKNINMIERWISIALNLKLWKSSTYMFSRIPNQLNWESVIWVTIAAIVAAGIGALIPAITAARVKPVDILRYE